MEKYKLLITICLLFLVVEVNGQRFIARNGYVRFFSEAPLENIEAVNTEGMSLLDTATNEIVFNIPISDFEFDKSLMQKHFNENYMESDKYPKSTFKGKIVDFKPGSKRQNLTAEGDLTIHGVTKRVKVEGTGEVNDHNIVLKAEFPVKLEDYKIKIPRVVMYNIAEVVDVTIEFEFVPYEGS